MDEKSGLPTRSNQTLTPLFFEEADEIYESFCDDLPSIIRQYIRNNYNFSEEEIYEFGERIQCLINNHGI